MSSRQSRHRGFFLLIPVVMAWWGSRTGSLKMVLETIPVLFLLISILPVCRKRQSLWLFVLVFFCAVPVNWFLMNRFPGWRNVLPDGSGNLFFRYLVRVLYDLILINGEEVAFGVTGRMLWHHQYEYNVNRRWEP